MAELRIGVKGRVISRGRYAGWYLLIEQGEKDEHGYFLYIADDDNPKNGYDSYLPDYGSLVATMKREGVTEIEWLEDG